jgi:hypothetical protein
MNPQIRILRELTGCVPQASSNCLRQAGLEVTGMHGIEGADRLWFCGSRLAPKSFRGMLTANDDRERIASSTNLTLSGYTYNMLCICLYHSTKVSRGCS